MNLLNPGMLLENIFLVVVGTGLTALGWIQIQKILMQDNKVKGWRSFTCGSSPQCLFASCFSSLSGPLKIIIKLSRIVLNSFTVEISHLKVHIQWSHDTDSKPVWFFSLCFPRFSLFMNIFWQVSQRTAVAFLGWFSVCCLKEDDVEKNLGHSGQR